MRVMSRAFALVAFPDGQVRGALYNGTSDVLFPWLWDSTEEAWAHYHLTYRGGELDDDEPQVAERDWYEEPVGDVEDVVIYSDYGRGFSWPGKAARNIVVGGTMPWEECYEQMVNGRPEWAETYLRSLDAAAP